MYSYSPIKELRIRNFRNLGDVTFSFEKSPIITLVGENEAGKTSVIKAFSTCALHAYPRDQKDCIRDGTTMFGIQISLEDGTEIIRVKENGGINLYRVLNADEEIIFDSSKITDGLPDEVQKILGLITEPETGEFLHVRTYEDKLLFVVTPSSTNYKVMYNALKVEQLTKAIKIGSLEVNSIKQQITVNDVSINTLYGQLKSINIVDTEHLNRVKNSLSKQLTILEKLENVKIIKDRIDKLENELGALALINIYGLKEIDEIYATRLYNISKLLENRINLGYYKLIINKVDSLEIIDTNILNKLVNILETKNMLYDKKREAGSLLQVTDISELNEGVIKQLNKAKEISNKLKSLIEQQNKIFNAINNCDLIESNQLSVLNKISKIRSLYSDIERKQLERQQIVNYIEQVTYYFKQLGISLETCPKCGETIIFDISKLYAQ